MSSYSEEFTPEAVGLFKEFDGGFFDSHHHKPLRQVSYSSSWPELDRRLHMRLTIATFHGKPEAWLEGVARPNVYFRVVTPYEPLLGVFDAASGPTEDSEDEDSAVYRLRRELLDAVEHLDEKHPGALPERKYPQAPTRP